MATNAPLKFLRIKQFRGSTKDFSLAFESNKSLTLIYGENGSGKTTICDAFDFLGNGKVGSLENRGLGQIHPFWPTVGRSHADILVEMSIDGQTWQARANSKNVSITPAGSPPPKVEVLRRSSILRLVQDAPKEKYDALKPFIDISLVEQAETTLRNQVKASSTTLNTAANRIAENRDTLNRLFREAGSKQTSALAWAANIVKKPPKDPNKDISALRAAIKAIEAVASLKDQSEEARLGATTAKDDLVEKKGRLVAAELNGMDGDAAFERILYAAKNHFSQHAVGEFCPLCQSNPPALQPACASVGVLLEAICDYLTARYECDVPRKKSKLTLGDMLPKVCDKRLAAALRVEVKQADGSFSQMTLGDKLIQLREMAQLRNIFGCHYNELARILPQKDALAFAALVLEVGGALICEDEGWPGSDKSGAYWATRNETRRLFPLKKPT